MVYGCLCAGNSCGLASLRVYSLLFFSIVYACGFADRAIFYFLSITRRMNFEQKNRGAKAPLILFVFEFLENFFTNFGNDKTKKNYWKQISPNKYG
jgi:hypothetical protein